MPALSFSIVRFCMFLGLRVYEFQTLHSACVSALGYISFELETTSMALFAALAILVAVLQSWVTQLSTLITSLLTPRAHYKIISSRYTHWDGHHLLHCACKCAMYKGTCINFIIT